MGNYKKADRRLVQPQTKHYKHRFHEDGSTVEVLCGPYSLEQRDQYFEVMISLYMTRYPKAKQSKARQATFQKWRMMVFATIGDEYVPTKKKTDDSVEVKGGKSE